MLNRMLKTAATALVAVSLVSCGGGQVHGVDLAITDAPLDTASSVIISFSLVQLSGPDVSSFTIKISPASSIDLYSLQGGIAATIIAGMQVQPGHYTNLRVTIASDPNTPQSSISLPDGLHNLYVPSGVSSDVNVPIDFTIASGGDVTLTMDFDLRKSIIQDPNDPTKYQLIPSIRAVQNELSGSITGSVATSLITCLDPSVYVYSGDVTPTDVDITAPASRVQPLSTALVGFNQTTANYNFTAGFLPVGDYTVAFTCESTLDVANQSNAITFTSVTHATVQSHLTTFVNLD
jgi:hypothetical protein